MTYVEQEFGAAPARTVYDPSASHESASLTRYLATCSCSHWAECGFPAVRTAAVRSATEPCERAASAGAKESRARGEWPDARAADVGLPAGDERMARSLANEEKRSAAMRRGEARANRSRRNRAGSAVDFLLFLNAETSGKELETNEYSISADYAGK